MKNQTTCTTTTDTQYKHPSTLPRLKTHTMSMVVIGWMLCNPMVAQQPADPESNILERPTRSGDEWRTRGAYDEAIKAYASQLAARDSDPTAKKRMAATNAAVGMAWCHIETGHHTKAVEILNDHPPISGEDTSATGWHLTMSEAMALQGEYAAALEHAEQAVASDPDRCTARFALGRMQEALGLRDQAIKTYAWFEQRFLKPLPDDAEELTAAGSGYLRYSAMSRNPALVNRTQFVLSEVYLRAVEQIDRTCWPARIAAGDLLRSKSRHEPAGKEYLAALRINENLAAAHVGLGKISLDLWQFEQVEQQVKAALEINPQSAPANRLLAGLRLTERRYQAAKVAASEALNINPNDVEALGLAAAAAYGLNDSQAVTEFRRRAYKVTPKPAAFHAAFGDTLAALRQYAASETEYRLAIEHDPTDPHPGTELGLMYMQWGEEEKAHLALTAAFTLDAFDARTHNTLELLNEINQFQRLETEHFTIKYDHPDAVLIPYLADYLEDIHEEICDDYEVTLQAKTIIELCPEHRMFAVRITGKPWIPTVGACTGRVIALEAPRRSARLEGPYHIARVLRHEFTHTVTLAATENRIPHWFTEGLAVMQEDSPRSYGWRKMLAESLRQKNLFTLQSIDWGFIRPEKPNDRSRAYAQSEWMCEFIVDRFGYDAIPDMLRLYRSRQSQEDVLSDVTQLTQAEFDAAFAKWASKDASSWCMDTTPPEDVAVLRERLILDSENPDLWARLAKAELDRGNLEQAVFAAGKGVAIDDNHVGALETVGRVLWRLRQSESVVANRGEATGNRDGATGNQDATGNRDGVAGNQDAAGNQGEIDIQLLRLMSRLAEIDAEGWFAPKVLGTLAVDRGDHDAAIPMLQRLKSACPGDPYADRTLAGIFLTSGDNPAALKHLLELARVEENDAGVAEAIADIYRSMERWHDARYWYLQTIFINAYEIAPHLALAYVYGKLGQAKGVAGEYAALCLLESDNVEYLKQASLAHAAIGATEAAAEFSRRAEAITPIMPEKR